MTTPESNSLAPTELKSDEELAKQLTNDLFESWVADPESDGDYVLHLGPASTSRFFKDMEEAITSLLAQHTGQLRQRIERAEAETERCQKIVREYNASIMDDRAKLKTAEDRLALVERERERLEVGEQILKEMVLSMDAELSALRQQAAKDGADRERIDWLERPLIGLGRSEHADPEVRYCVYHEGRSSYGPSIRAAVDSAREGSK